MPSRSMRQHRLMEGIAHGWKPTGMKKPPPKSVATEFAKADRAAGKYRKKGGRL